MALVAVSAMAWMTPTQASPTAKRLPAACRGMDLSNGETRQVQRDLCTALARGDVAALIKLCRTCKGEDLAAESTKWRNRTYRKAMLAALKSGGYGADIISFPAFASRDVNFTGTLDDPTATVHELSRVPADTVAGARRYLGLAFPDPIPEGWTPDYHGPVIVIGYFIDPITGKDGYEFEGTYDYGATANDGSWCNYPGKGCA